MSITPTPATSWVIKHPALAELPRLSFHMAPPDQVGWERLHLPNAIALSLEHLQRVSKLRIRRKLWEHVSRTVYVVWDQHFTPHLTLATSPEQARAQFERMEARLAKLVHPRREALYLLEELNRVFTEFPDQLLPTQHVSDTNSC